MRLALPFPRSENTPTLLRRLGYSPDRFQNSSEPSYHRRIRGFSYPKFHVYVQVDRADRLELTLHVDMKQPSYAGSAAHAGEYDGPLVAEEASRIERAIRTFAKA